MKKLTKFNQDKMSAKDFEELLKSIQDLHTPEEIDKIRNAFLLMRASTKQKAKLLRPIVPIEEWLNDPYYIGPQAENLYPYWKEVLVDIFDSKHKINQIVLTGAIGTGKTSTATVAIIRKIYELSCYENVAALFNLFSISRIAFAYLSVTREQALNTGFSLLLEWIDSIPYFRENFPRKENLDSMLIWPQERLLVTCGSEANHFIRMNLIGSILDEANYLESRAKDDANFGMNTEVSSLYIQIMKRSQSRFIIDGVNHSLSIVVSSATVNSSFTDEIIEKAKDDPHTYVSSPSLWDVKSWEYGTKRFLVYAGGEGSDPQVIDTLDELNIILESSGHKPITFDVTPVDAIELTPPEIQSKLIRVPEEHRQAFQTDIIIALQDLAGFSASNANKLFSSRVM